MSRRPIDLSPPLKKLRDEGYDIEVVDGYLLMYDVPYVNKDREVKFGVLITSLRLNNNVAQAPDDHQVKFAGDLPCHEDGRAIEGLGYSAVKVEIAGLCTNWNFSCKPKPADRYDDFPADLITSWSTTPSCGREIWLRRILTRADAATGQRGNAITAHPNRNLKRSPKRRSGASGGG